MLCENHVMVFTQHVANTNTIRCHVFSFENSLIATSPVAQLLLMVAFRCCFTASFVDLYQPLIDQLSLYNII